MTAKGITKVGVIRRKPPSEQWSVSLLDPSLFDIELPHQMDIHKIASFVRPELDQEAPPRPPESFVRQPADEPAVVRQLYVKRADLETHGYTPGCGKCNAMQANRTSTRPHSTECRRG